MHGMQNGAEIAESDRRYICMKTGAAFQDTKTKKGIPRMTGTILQNRRILPDAPLYDMRIHAPESAAKARPGQFLMLDCGEDTVLRRPISICRVSQDTLRICYEVRGKGTAKLAAMREGDTADFMGPIGNGYTSFAEGRVLLVGGGIGIYPLLFLADIYGKRATALLGFRSASRINLTEDFAASGCEVQTVTDDGSGGRGGFVTDLLREALQTGAYSGIHVCGPMPMMKAAAKIADAANVPCQVSLEERMGCGVGACMACVCKTLLRQDSTDAVHYKRVCVDGPVFDAKEILWK